MTANTRSPLGRSVRPLDWEKITSGQFKYIGDLAPEGMLFGMILRSPYAHARIASIDMSAARKMPGVHAVISSTDFPPGARYIHDGAQDRSPFADGVVRFVGQEIAAVAAESLEQAQAALAAIHVKYKALPAAWNIDQALAEEAPILHERPTGEPNIALKLERCWGDIETARAGSPRRVRGTYWFPQQAHVCMETNATVALWENGKLHLWTGTQAPFFVIKEMAQLLEMEVDDIVVHEIGVGGAFGAKSRIAEHEAITAVLAREAKRPVRIVLTRAEEFAMTKTRHGWRIGLELHASETGMVRAIDGDIHVDNGSYVHSGFSVMSSGPKALGTLYRAEAVNVVARLVDTCKQPGGQFRGYGTTQAVYALESLMDDLAEELRIDPLKLRLRNANVPYSETVQGAKLQTARMAECLRAVRTALDWDRKKATPKKGRGLGVATGFHSSGTYAFEGSNRNDSTIDLDTAGNLLIRFGGADTGTGQRTILTQIVSHNIGVPLERIRILSMESDQTPYDLGAWGSRGTYYSGNAAIKACNAVIDRLAVAATQFFGNRPVRFEDGHAVCDDEKVSIGDLVKAHPETVDGVLSTTASFIDETSQLLDEKGRGNFSATYSFAAHAAEVEVDLKTGKLRVVDFAAAHDIGTALNPVMVHGQIAGGVQMGGGAALGEEMLYEQGRVINPAFMNYAMARAGDLPHIKTILVEGGDPKGPHGAKGIGELCNTPPAPAIANAVYDATGVRITELPITPDKILTALAKKEGRHRDHALWSRPGRWWISFVRWLYPRGLLKVLHAKRLRLARVEAPRTISRIDSPQTLSAAVKLSATGGTTLAGGTDLLPAHRQGLARTSSFVSIVDIPELNEVRVESDGSFVLGAAVTLARAAEYARTACPVLGDTIRTIASSQIRAMATVGGNLLQGKRCWFYRNGFDCYKRSGGMAPCYAVAGDHRFYHAVIDGHRCQAVTPSDLATTLTALEAKIVVAGPNGQRTLPIDRLYSGPGESSLQPGEILVRTQVPARPHSNYAVFEKLALWEGDFAIASAAIAADQDVEGRWRNVRIALGGVSPTPYRAIATERALEGTIPNLAKFRTLLDRELNKVAHPLPKNGWKLDAVAGVVENAAERLIHARGSSK
ncbi:MAG: molybdopterin-dependent oxidoreductase [Proteobacteria bacterium]|nr:molybdopterin-dependent oxidoreductase [Pseudomonadota bacterium]